MTVVKRTFTSLLIVPLIGMSVLTVQPTVFGGDQAYAQSRASVGSFSPNTSTPNTTTPSRDTGGGGEGPRLSRIPPCPPGTAPTPNCRPWTPPVRVADSKDECTCQMKRVNGRIIKDCYVLVGKLVHYCHVGHLRILN